jgi:hypothetical protein
MVLTAPASIEAPAVTPARGGLLAVADVTDVTSGDHIEMGVNYYSYLCGTVGLYPAWCGTAPGIDYDAVKAFSGGQSSSGYPFVVYSGVECDLFGREEYGPAARARLAGGEDTAVAKAFLGQQFFGVGVPPVDVSAPITDLPTAVVALGKLEQYAAVHYAGLPVIHMNRATATLLSNYLEIALDGTLTTLQGTPVANSAGYPDAFMFVTGAVHAWRSAVTTVAVDNPLKNTAMGLAERSYVVTTDCLLAYAGTAPTTVPAPTLTTVAPTSGLIVGGTVVTLTGTGFTAGEVTGVTFGGVPAASWAITSATTITATTPEHAQGVVDVVVVGTSGNATKAGGFTYTVPTITSIAPLTGSANGGTAVTITGTNLTGALAAGLGNTFLLNFVVVNATTITGTTQAHAVGLVDALVRFHAGDISKTGAFTFTAPPPAPTVTGVGPDSGPAAGATDVTIFGSNFTGATGATFGGVAATNFVVVNAAQVTATTPAHAAGVVNVTVTGPGGTGTGTGVFTYNAAAALAVEAINPTEGGTTGGEDVTVTGSGF